MKGLFYLSYIICLPALASAEALDGRIMANTCAGCHGGLFQKWGLSRMFSLTQPIIDIGGSDLQQVVSPL